MRRLTSVGLALFLHLRKYIILIALLQYHFVFYKLPQKVQEFFNNSNYIALLSPLNEIKFGALMLEKSKC